MTLRFSETLPAADRWKVSLKLNEQLPDHWRSVRLSEVAAVQNGAAFASSKFNRDGRGMPLVRIRDVGSSGTATYYDGEWEDRYLVLPGSILIGMDGEFRAREWTSAKALLNQRVCRVDPDEAFYDRGFMLAVLQPYLAAVEAVTSSVTVKHLSSRTIERLRLPLPPRPEQRRIVAKLDALQSHSRKARAALDAIPTLLDRFRQSVLAAAFRGDLTADWRAAHPDVEPASALLARIRVERKKRWIADYIDTMTDRARKRAEKKGKPWTDADEAKARKGYAKKAAEKYQEPAPAETDSDDLYDLPFGWCWTPLQLVGEIKNGRKRVNPASNRPTRAYLRIANVKDDRIDFSDINEMARDDEVESAFTLEPGDILVSAGQALGKVGQSAMFDAGMPDVGFQMNLFRFRVLESVLLPEFVQLVFRAWVRLGFFMRRSSITTNLAYMTTTRFARCPMPVPPIAEQKRIVESAGEAMRAAERSQGLATAGIADVDRLDQSILAKAFRGELVPQDPTDEPAADLLARIQKERKGSGRR